MNHLFSKFRVLVVAVALMLTSAVAMAQGNFQRGALYHLHPAGQPTKMVAAGSDKSVELVAFDKDNTALYEAVNKALQELIADGSVQKIIDKYIPAE